MWKASLSVMVVMLTSVGLGLAAPAPNPWPEFAVPAPGPARAIGDYSAGCLQGAKPLALDGPGYQVMRPSRRRYFGHPDLIDFIRDFGHRVHADRTAPLLIGDLSQPRGGRAASGHSSHQTGLDVDVWFKSHPRAQRGRLPTPLRETLAAESVVDVETQSIVAAERARVATVLRLVVQDARVERVFVHPIIKRTLCETSGESRSWLHKLRPWHGHDDHFHVRLACPAQGADCQPQAPLPPGDGCDKLAFWFDVDAQKARQTAKQDYQQSVRQGRGWPDRCNALLMPQVDEHG